MSGREEQKANDLFFTCSLIDYIARKIKNKRSAVVNALGRPFVARIYDLADVYHSDNIDAVSDDFIADAHITEGTFDNVAAARYAIPSHWDIGKVYKRLILGIAREKNIAVVDALFKAYIPLSATRLTITTAASIMMRRRISLTLFLPVKLNESAFLYSSRSRSTTLFFRICL